MRHLIDSETGKVYPFPPNSENVMDLQTWLAMVALIDQGRGRYDPETDSLQLVQS